VVDGFEVVEDAAVARLVHEVASLEALEHVKRSANGEIGFRRDLEGARARLQKYCDDHGYLEALPWQACGYSKSSLHLILTSSFGVSSLG
jgi:hypothetical protein